MPGAIRAFFDFLAKMGLTIRDDPPKTLDLDSREWGTEKDGFALSIAAGAGVISVVLRNISSSTRHLVTPEFSRWFELRVQNAELTPFGEQLLKCARNGSERHLIISPGQTVHGELPIEAIYRLDKDISYEVNAGCTVSRDSVVTSNTVIFRP